VWTGTVSAKGNFVRLILIATLAATAAAPSPAQKARRPAAQKAPQTAVVGAGSEQALKIGRVTVQRPFGAELVDRLVLVGSYRVGGRRVHLVRGDANGACPSRFVFLAEQPGGQPVPGTPFGTCNGRAVVRSAAGALLVTVDELPGTVPLAPGAPPPVRRFAYDGATLRPLDRPPAGQGPDCVPPARVGAVEQAETIAAFEREFPREFGSRGQLNRVAIAPDEMRSVVTALACLAPWPAGERRVPRAAVPLFASRHGPAAFAALESVAEDPSSGPYLRASARGLKAEMSYYLSRREPL